jgi:serine/threonine-protein kinase
MAADSTPTADSRATRRIGQTVGGKYELRGVLGVGGMATVYAGTHRNGLAVAVKVLHDDLASDESVRRWFLREAYLANRVNHRGAVRVLDDDVTEDGAAYLVIERLYGDTLRAIWERAGRKMPAKEVALFAYDVLDVLSAAHARGIIHRDIKPENLFVTDEGEVKVLDFGIAHPLPVMGEAAAMTTMRLVGTPAYMAPEQARGTEVRAETDVWGVGATMFSLITGEYVHAGAPPPDLLTWAATRHARRVGELARDLPSGLAAVMDRALAFEPEQRFATAHAMREALGEAFASAFGGTIGDARGAVIGEMKGREPVAGRTARGGDVHSVATRAPGRQLRAAAGQNAYESNAGGATRTMDAGIDSAHLYGGALYRPWLLRLLIGALAAMVLLSLLLLFDSHRRTNAEQVARVSSAGTAYYDSGMRAMYEASTDVARSFFSKATEADPALAQAHLRYAMLESYPDDTARAHFSDAQRLRVSLSSEDQELLDALEPLNNAVPDPLASVARLTAAIQRSPKSVILRLALTRRLPEPVNESETPGTRVY